MSKALTNYKSLVRDIQRGQIEPIYFFYGPEQILAQYVVGVLQAALIEPGMEEVNVVKLDGQKTSELELVRAIETPPMFGKKRLIIIEQPPFIKPKQGASFPQWTDLLDDWPPYACCVLLAREVDRRLRGYKELADKAALFEFPVLTIAEAGRWVEDRLRLSKIRYPANSGRFVVERCGTDLESLRLEVEKIISFADGKALSQADLELIVSDNADTNIFDLVDAIGLQNLSKAWSLLVPMLDTGSEPVYLLAMIARQLRLLLVARLALDAGLSQRQAAASLGIHPFPAGKCVQQARSWTAPKLQAAMLNCLQADERIKTGALRGESALTQLLLDLINN